jgi:hypothetical protein
MGKAFPILPATIALAAVLGSSFVEIAKIALKRLGETP